MLHALPLAESLAETTTSLSGWLTGLFSGTAPGPGESSSAAGIIVASILKATVIVLIVQIGMLYATWGERKIIGRMQDRLGPNRVGLFGLAQPFADMFKMLTKEDITPTAAHKWVYNLGAILVVPPAIIGFAVVALDRNLIAADLSIGALFFFAIGSTAVMPIFMAGWGSRNKYALLGAMRAVAQVVSYEIPQVLSIVGVLLLAGTLSMNGLIHSQGPIGDAFPGVWFILLQPIAFVIFLLATTAEIERTPFDIPEAESEIIAGYHTEYAGIKFGLFYLALYFVTISASAVGAILFLGGWQPPFGFLAGIPGWIWMTGKTLALVFVFMWLRGTLPRLRVDQLMAFAWKVLVPISLINLMVTGLLAKLVAGWAPWKVLGAFTVANIVMVALLIWLVAGWRRFNAARQITFERPAVKAVGAALRRGAA